MPLKSIPGEELACRDLPFTTLMYLFSKIAEQVRVEIFAERSRIIEAISQITSSEGTPTKEQIQGSIQLMWPVLTRIIMDTEEVSLRVFRDVIIDATDNHIRALSVVDLLTVLEVVMSRIDPDMFAEKIQSVFTQAMVVWNKATASQNKKSEKEEQQENSQTNTPSSQQEASPE